MSESVTQTSSLRAGVAEEIRALLGRRRMSDIALARGIGRSHTYMWRRLTGETAFDIDDLERIADVLGVSVVDLLPRKSGSTEGYSALAVRTIGHLPTQPRKTQRRPPSGPSGHRPPSRPATLPRPRAADLTR